METQKKYASLLYHYSHGVLICASLLFGCLFNHLDDYVLRIFVSDILRHLLANNFEIGELWDQSSEDVMEFPATQDLDAGTVSKILYSMSGLDAHKAFRGERYRCSFSFIS